MLDQVQNFVKEIVSGTHVAADTTINVVDASLFPDPTAGEYNLTWWDATNYPDPSGSMGDPNCEIVRVTARDTGINTLTVTRAQEGTSATDKNTVGATYLLALTPTKKNQDDIAKILNPASAVAPASLDLHEDTDNGTNKITIKAPASISEDRVLDLPDATDTLVGKNTTDTLTNKTLDDPLFSGTFDGWVIADGTWSASDANTISVASLDLTGVLQKGDKIKLTNNSATKYFYITTTPAFSTNTTFDVTGEVDLVAGAITNANYSKIENPQGFKRGEIWYKARAHASATQALSANIAATITCNVEDFDINSNYNTSTYVYTAPITGYYRISGRCKGNNLAANERIFLTTVGGTGAGGGADIQGTGTGSYIAATVSNIVYATKGTSLYVQVTTTAGADTQYDDATSIWQSFEFLSI